MEILKATYIVSSPSYTSCPEPDRPEYAFIGRSNVGKSSVLNMLCNMENLAKTSSSPGKTQLINHFSIDSTSRKEGKALTKENSLRWYMVDLPGYGFAKVSQAQRKNWEKMIEDYIRKRENLGVLFVLVDSRLKPQALDLEFIGHLGEWSVPFALIFTKSDKNTQKEVAENVRSFLAALSEHWETLPPHFVTSAEKGTGRKALLAYIDECNSIYAQAQGTPARKTIGYTPPAGTTKRKPLP